MIWLARGNPGGKEITMSDYISREAAIEAVREKFGCETCNGSNVGIICTFCNVGEAILAIKNIPAADVEPVVHG